jgi:ubiquinone biosynthesis protein
MDGDSSKILDSLEMMGALQEDTDTKNFKEEIEDMLDCYKNVPIKELDINLLLEDSFSIMRKYYIKIPSNLTILIKTLITLEGIGLSLDPDFSIAVSMKPFVTKFISERIRIKNIFKDAVNISYGMFRVFKEMPASFTSFLKMLKKGSISISFEHKGLRELINIIDKSSSRLSFSLIIASLIISSSLIMVSGAAPLIFGFPAFGVVFFCVSAILGIWLIIDIIKHRSL